MNAPHIPFRPSSIPLVTVDPYFSIWSAADALYLDHTRHWTGRRNAIVGSVRIDGVPYRFLGLADNDEWSARRTDYASTLTQTSLKVTPTATIAVMENEVLWLEVTFRTPLLLSDPSLLSRPITYVSWRARFKDGAPHDFRFYFDVTADAVVSDLAQTVVAEKTELGYRIGRNEQIPLSKSGDDLTIDWGYLHLVHPEASVSAPLRRRIFHGHRRTFTEPDQAPTPARSGLGIALDTDKTEGMLMLAYDDLGKSIDYFGEHLGSYYLSSGMTFDRMLADSFASYAEITAACERFDAEMTEEMRKISDDYAEVGALVYRQAIAAHKLVRSEKDGMLFLSKECFSNGCIATLDVTYPSIPLFLRYAPEFVRAMMTPIFRFAKCDAWTYEYAPHDCGQYPFCTGQVYGKQPDGTLAHDMQMPVEECGNALLTVVAVCRAEGSISYAKENEELLNQWAEYLVKAGYNPENQLCTDDFAGRLAQNCNLSVKAIVALAAYGDLLGIERYSEAAREMAARWCSEAKTEVGTRLTFDNPNSWSLKYNLVWDKLFGLDLFPEEIYRGEIESYRSHMNRYGVPLDSRREYTKLDWEMWTTVLTDDKAYLAEVVRAIRRTVCETPTRVPVSDWYETVDGMQVNFQNRTVLGGYFIPQLVGFFK